MKWFWAVLGLVVAGLIVVFALGNRHSTPTASTGAPLTVTSADHIDGNPKAKATLIEYGDFQCPSCGAFFPVVTGLQKEFGSQLRLVFRHFPLSQLHPNALPAARAAEAAGKQGKFFAMYAKIYQNQSSWAESTNAQAIFEQYAKDIGLDIGRYQSDYGSQAVIDVINSDIKSGQSLGVNSTPTFFVNGQQVELNKTTDLKTAIENALKG